MKEATIQLWKSAVSKPPSRVAPTANQEATLKKLLDEYHATISKPEAIPAQAIQGMWQSYGTVLAAKSKAEDSARC